MNKLKTKHYLQKRLIRSLFGQWGYVKIKFYKIMFDYFIGKDYDYINSFWNNHLSKDAVIVDVGANMGQCMLRYSKNKNRAVISIEPVPTTFKFLSKAVQLFQRKNVILVNAAIGNKHAKVKIYIPYTENNLLIDTQASLDSYLFDTRKINYITENTEMKTLEEIFVSNKINKVDLIKVDAEGAEEIILLNSIEIIEKYFPIISLESSPSAEYLHTFFKMGYIPYYIVNSDLIQASDLSESVAKKGNLILIKEKFS